MDLFFILTEEPITRTTDKFNVPPMMYAFKFEAINDHAHEHTLCELSLFPSRHTVVCCNAM